MHRLTPHLRGLMVAITTLALTAGVAFAARPTGDTGLERATDASGRTVPTEQVEEEPTVPEENEDEEAEEPATEDEEGAEADGERPENHGWYVSEAAKGPTPDGYRNHGEYVSEIARGDDGKPSKDEAAEDDDEAEATAGSSGQGRSSEAKARNAERKAGRGGG